MPLHHAGPDPPFPRVEHQRDGCGISPLHLPDHWHTWRDDRLLPHRRTVHDPDRQVASLRLAPDNIRLAVAIDVAKARNLPDERHLGSDDGPLRDRRTIHEPRRHIACLYLTPEEIGLAVGVEVPHAGNL